MPGRLGSTRTDIRSALETFVVAFCELKSRTHPYLTERVGDTWRLFDAPRKRVVDTRKEEWIAFDVPPKEVHRAARAGAQGRFFLGILAADAASERDLRAQYKQLGYRLIATEPLFVHRLTRIPRCRADADIELVRTPSRAEQFAKATRTRPVPREWLQQPDYRQYVALREGEIVGWVRSVETPHGAWCSNMVVRPAHRRQGVGKALLERMLRDDRARGLQQSVLLSSHTGALLYPHLGYEQAGVLLIYAPRRTGRS